MDKWAQMLDIWAFFELPNVILVENVENLSTNGKNWKNLNKFDQKWMEILRICFPTFIMAE